MSKLDGTIDISVKPPVDVVVVVEPLVVPVVLPLVLPLVEPLVVPPEVVPPPPPDFLTWPRESVVLKRFQLEFVVEGMTTAAASSAAPPQPIHLKGKRP
jgi:hypothetical protein